MKQQKYLFLTLILLLFTGWLFAQQAITGTVTDSTGNRLASVSVLVPGTSVGTSTNENGKFNINVPQGTTQLEFSLIGYHKQTVAVGTRTDLVVTLLPV